MSVSAAFETVRPVYFLEVSLQQLPLHTLKFTVSGACVRMHL